jgi:hypothetical protein
VPLAGLEPAARGLGNRCSILTELQGRLFLLKLRCWEFLLFATVVKSVVTHIYPSIYCRHFFVALELLLNSGVLWYNLSSHPVFSLFRYLLQMPTIPLPKLP